MAGHSADRQQNENRGTGKAAAGEEVRTGSVTAGTNGGTSNRQDYQPANSDIKPDEPGGTEGRGKEK